MHCHFHLREIDGLYYIDFHEDILQPYVSFGLLSLFVSRLVLTSLLIP